MKTKIIAGTVAALLLASMLTMTTFYTSQVRAAATTIVSYSPIELYRDTTLQNDYKFIGCDGFIVKNMWVTLDLNGHKVIGSTPTSGMKGIRVNGSEFTGGEIRIKNGEIEGFHIAIDVYGCGYVNYENWVYIENIKTKGNNNSALLENSLVRISDCSFEEGFVCWFGTVFIDSDTKVAWGA